MRQVIIVDDHEIFRDGLRTVIESDGATRVVGEASTVHEATRLIEEQAFDLLVLDLSLPGVSGLSLLREMRRLGRAEPVLVLTMHADPDIAAEALAAGAQGFALKSESRAALLEAVDKAMCGERFIASGVPREALDNFLNAQSPNGETPLALLTAREKEIFDLLMRGYDNEAIAASLFISAKTVDTHRTRVFRKLGVHSLGELLRFGFRHRPGGAGALETSATPRKGRRR